MLMKDITSGKGVEDVTEVKHYELINYIKGYAIKHSGTTTV